DAFRDADDQVQAGVNAFENRVGCESGGDKNGGRRRPGLLHGLGHSVEDRDLVFKQLPTLARRDAGNDLGAIGEAELRVPRAEAAGDALNQDASLWGDEDGHGTKEQVTFWKLR